VTDNRNRSASNVRAAFTKAGGALGETGSVSFMWNRVGEIYYPASVGSDDKVVEAAIEAGADDVQSDEDGHTIICAFESVGDVSKAPWARSERPKAKIDPLASSSAAFFRVASFSDWKIGPRPRIETCQVYH